MSSRRKASTPCMIRPEQTMVELDDEAEEPQDMEVHFILGVGDVVSLLCMLGNQKVNIVTWHLCFSTWKSMPVF